jgi:hypothetical protein
MNTGNSPKSPKPGAGGTVSGAGKPAGANKPQPPNRPAADIQKSGRVQFDDRGNAVWEWSTATGGYGREVSTERLRKLENPGLSLQDDVTTTPVRGNHKVMSNPQGTVKGYNPYDSGKLGKAEAAKKKDLKKLSDWLKLKKQAANNKPDD